MSTDLLLSPRDLTEDHFRADHPVHETGDVYHWLHHFFGARESAVNEAYARIDDWLTERGANTEEELDSHGTETDESYEARLFADRHRSPTMSLAIWREAVLQLKPEVADCIECGKPDGTPRYNGLCWRCQLVLLSN